MLGILIPAQMTTGDQGARGLDGLQGIRGPTGLLATSNQNGVQGDFQVGGSLHVDGSITAMNTVTKGPSFDGVNGTIDASGICAFAQKLVDTSTNYVPNYFISFGNAADDTITTKTFGTQSNGNAVPANPYFRCASQTKMVACMVLAKMMEERLVYMETLLDTYLGNYDDSSGINGDKIYDFSGNLLKHPWLIQNKSFSDNSGNFYWGYDHVPNMLAPRNYNASNDDCKYFNYDSVGKLISGHMFDASGATTITPVNAGLKWGYGPCVNFFNFVHKNDVGFTPRGPSNPMFGADGPIQLNLKALTSMGLGINYDAYWALMNYQGSIQACGDYEQAARIKEFGYVGFYAVIAAGQLNGPITNPQNPLPKNQITNYGPDQYLGRLATMPFTSFPFEYYSYSMEYDILGFFMDQVIKQKYKSLYTDIMGYFDKKFLKPLGISDFWMFYGQSQPPVDVKTNMMSSSEWREGTVTTSKYGVDGKFWDFGYGFDGSYNKLRWSDNIPTTGNTQLHNDLFYMDQNTNIKHVGTFNAGCALSVNSYSKLLRLYCNKGYDVVSKTRLISKAAINYIMQPSMPLSSQFITLGNINSRDHEELQTQAGMMWSFGCAMVPTGGWVLERAKATYSNMSGSYMGPIQIYPYPFNTGSRFWNGSSNTFFYCNIETGAWIHGGTQQLTHSKKTLTALSTGNYPTSNTTPLITILDASC